MNRVVLLGDSIRLGYQATVRVELADLAHVLSCNDNGQHTVNELMNLHQWAIVHQPDLVHVNAGLWDMRRIARGTRENLVPPDTYRANVTRLVRLLKQHTPATVVWATTTPVDHPRANRTSLRNGMVGRDGDDVALYNQIAVEAATSEGAIVNDLHALVEEIGRDRILSDDGVHFTADGYELLGRRVAACIAGQLRGRGAGR